MVFRLVAAEQQVKLAQQENKDLSERLEIQAVVSKKPPKKNYECYS